MPSASARQNRQQRAAEQTQRRRFRDNRDRDVVNVPAGTLDYRCGRAVEVDVDGCKSIISAEIQRHESPGIKGISIAEVLFIAIDDDACHIKRVAA